MKKIWKYEIHCDSILDGFHFIDILAPAGARPLCVMAQGRSVFVWMEVDTLQQQKEKVRFCCVGTGHGCVPTGMKYFGSVFVDPYVWHLYWQE